MNKEEINNFLRLKCKESAANVKKYFSDPQVLANIERRKKLKKFGLALSEGNEGITVIAKEEYFIEKEDNKVILKKKEIPKMKSICRYCQGNHMSFKCPQKTKTTKNFKKSIKISNLPFDITEDELYDLFYDFGKVEKVTIPHSIKYRDDVCKYAYVNFSDPKVAQQAVNELDGTHFDHLIINVCLQ